MSFNNSSCSFSQVSVLSTIITPDADPTSIVWAKVSDTDLEKLAEDGLAISMAKYDERKRREREAFLHSCEEKERKRLEAEEAERKRKEAEEAERKREEQKREEERREREEEESLKLIVAAPCGLCSRTKTQCTRMATGRSRACINCQSLKARCDLAEQTLAEKRAAVAQSGRKSVKRQRRTSDVKFGAKRNKEKEDESEDEEEEVVAPKPGLRFVPFEPSTESVAQVLDRCLGEIVNSLDRNTAAVSRMGKDLRDLSGHLDESFAVLRTLATSLAKRALNEDEERRLDKRKGRAVEGNE